MTRANRSDAMTLMWQRGASASEIAEAFGVQNPAVYKALRHTGALPPYRPRQAPIRSAGRVAKEKRALPPSVSRDPCQRCGTRADIGCQHSAPSQAGV